MKNKYVLEDRIVLEIKEILACPFFRGTLEGQALVWFECSVLRDAIVLEVEVYPARERACVVKDLRSEMGWSAVHIGA